MELPQSLKRIRVMNIKLGNLKPGEYRELDRAEVTELYRACGMDSFAAESKEERNG